MNEEEKKQLINLFQTYLSENDLSNNIENDEVFTFIKNELKKCDRWKNSPKKIQGVGGEYFFEKAWSGMPEFIQEDLMPIKNLIVNFKDIDSIESFSKMVNQKITSKTKSIWFPKQETIKPSDYTYL